MDTFKARQAEWLNAHTAAIESCSAVAVELARMNEALKVAREAETVVSAALIASGEAFDRLARATAALYARPPRALTH